MFGITISYWYWTGELVLVHPDLQLASKEELVEVIPKIVLAVTAMK